METRLIRIGLLAGSAFAVASLAACGGGGSSDPVAPPPVPPPVPVSTLGTLAVALTDSPACGFDAINVTVSKVRVNKSASAGDADGGWVDVSLSPPRKIDLLKLNNGVLDTLGSASLDAGHYSQVRLVLDANASGSANTVVPGGAAGEQALATLSGIQGGILVGGEFDVAAGQKTDILLDFDACRSILAKAGRYVLNPVVRIVPSVANGISGVVAAPGLANHVAVWAQQGGKIVASTAPDDDGAFVLAHLAAGDYDVVITSDNSVALVVSAVPVTATATTAISTAAAPIALPVSGTGLVSGTVAISPPPSTDQPVFVAVTQVVASGKPVTVKYQGADLATGAYALFPLPLAAPQYAAYSRALPLSFNTDATVAPGRYVLAATAGASYLPQYKDVDISGADQTGVDLTLVPVGQ